MPAHPVLDSMKKHSTGLPGSSGVPPALFLACRVSVLAAVNTAAGSQRISVHPRQILEAAETRETLPNGTVFSSAISRGLGSQGTHYPSLKHKPRRS